MTRKELAAMLRNEAAAEEMQTTSHRRAGWAGALRQAAAYLDPSPEMRERQVSAAMTRIYAEPWMHEPLHAAFAAADEVTP